MVVFLSILVLWVVSLCCHEYAHARVAFAGGDHSVAAMGYLTMNPLRYVHPMMSIVIPLIILAIGGIPLPGGAVYIDESRLRSRGWSAAVSAAGPAANLLLLILASIPFALGLHESASDSGSLWATLGFFAFLQAGAVVFNLIPIPSLDGFGILAPWLPYTWRRNARLYSNYFFFGFLLLLINSDAVGGTLDRLRFGLTDGLGIPFATIVDGYRQFMSVARL